MDDCLFDEVEADANISADKRWEIALPPHLFQPGGLYYEMRRENQKLFHDTGKGCSVCGSLPVVNVSGSYWLCGGCVDERMQELNDLRDRTKYDTP